MIKVIVFLMFLLIASHAQAGDKDKLIICKAQIQFFETALEQLLDSSKIEREYLTMKIDEMEKEIKAYSDKYGDIQKSLPEQGQ